jgi:parallel beta-helix repeat protein
MKHIRGLSVMLVGMALAGSPAAAATITVNAGPGTPLQDAIDAASPGDTLRLSGIFREAVVIDKQLKVKGPAAINPACGPAVVVTIAADGVTMKRLVIFGGSIATIDIQNRDDVRLSRLSLASQPFEGGCAAAQYGINVLSSTNLKLSRNDTIRSGPGTSYPGAFIRLSAIAPGARVKVLRSFSNYDNGVGILVEDSDTMPASPPGLKLHGNRLVDSVTGILLSNSAGIQVTNNTASGGPGIGILADATSHDNRLLRNSGKLNDIVDARDDGVDNCWKNNTFATSQIPGCP